MTCTQTLYNCSIVQIQTFKNHDNLTNEELEWKEEIEKRELVRIRTGVGTLLEKRTRIKYKKERIGPWMWVLPVLLCLIACGLGVAANLHPKLEISLEPKGSLGRMVDDAYRKMSYFDKDRDATLDDTGDECLPYASFGDFLRDNKHVGNVLMGPVVRFYNRTETVVKDARSVLKGMRKQLLLDAQEELFGDSLENIWEEYKLQYLGMLFTAPRFICLLILFFGWITAFIWVCQMSIIQALEPARVVGAFGKVAVFSFAYVVGTQLALFHLISAFGVPFYHVNLRFGLGFVYDVAADCLMLALYVGMKNEFFFSVPKRKTTVTYSIPGVSQGGPNIEGQIV